MEHMILRTVQRAREARQVAKTPRGKALLYAQRNKYACGGMYWNY